jgi:acyl carrier protein
MEDTLRMEDSIRNVLAEHGRLVADPGSIDENADLFDAGMTSHASVNVMLALEELFDFEFPESMLKRSTFESIAAIRQGVLEATAA